jgi:enoyl-[acyl-carrier protein] reductase III
MEEKRWALILGASSGFGAAAAQELARNGFNIIGVHLDRRATLAKVDKIRLNIEGQGSVAVFFNANAASRDKRGEIVSAIGQKLAGSKLQPPLKIFMHSLAFGVLRPFIACAPEEDAVNSSQMDLTLDVMAHSLVYWTQDLVAKGLLARGSRVFAMTSSGGDRVLPSYGAVSAAKAALEAPLCANNSETKSECQREGDLRS